eukprot:COSAG06_NODE_171_length_21398_cov_8.190948_8_plen_193_part_01
MLGLGCRVLGLGFRDSLAVDLPRRRPASTSTAAGGRWLEASVFLAAPGRDGSPRQADAQGPPRVQAFSRHSPDMSDCPSKLARIGHRRSRHPRLRLERLLALLPAQPSVAASPHRPVLPSARCPSSAASPLPVWFGGPCRPLARHYLPVPCRHLRPATWSTRKSGRQRLHCRQPLRAWRSPGGNTRIRKGRDT